MNNVLIKIAKEAVEIAKRFFFGESIVDTKTPFDFVTNADKIGEEFIINRISKISPNAMIYGKESGYINKNNKNLIKIKK